MQHSRTGRPPLNRNPVAGENLRQALQLLGKTWRRDMESQDHVLNWAQWTACELPRSATTIDRDMREGVPERRIAAYARCLGLLPEVLASPQTDMIRVLGMADAPQNSPVPTRVLGYRELFPQRYLDHNRDGYVRELYALMRGVYRMHYLLDGIDLIHRCTIWIYGAEAYRLLLRGRFIMFGVENSFEADMFRWHNNLHTHYLCENGMELGYVMTVDPLRHNLVRRREPFWLKGCGLTDRGLADNQPITFTLRKELLPLPPGLAHAELWERECEAVRKRPFIAPGEQDYEETRARVLAQEELA